MGKPIISADTPAIREAFSDGENIVLCRHADGESLAEAIIALLQDTNLQHRVGEGAYALVEAELTPRRVVQPLVKAFENL
jgi:glycosyltransferase involved in cell wall biosynthesis